MAQKTISLQLNQKEVERLKEVLLNEGWFEDVIVNEYVNLRMKNKRGSVCTLYTSMKVVFQGNEDFTDIIGSIRGREESEEDIRPRLGVDEVGKGDYFGPLVVVACFVNDGFIKKYQLLGVGDSKKFSDSRIRSMYEELKSYKYYYPSVIYPQGYNDLYKEIKNVAILLAKEHSRVIEMGLKDLKSKGIECKKVVIDQFSSKKNRITDELGPLALDSGIEFVQFHKGESDIAVAAASIIARGIFLEEMDNMKDEYYFDFPKGASNVIAPAKEFVKRYGVDELEKVAKISFKTTKKVI
jgi:ribonuclease HIII